MKARLCFIGHGLMENRSGLIVDAQLARVSGHAERLAALAMIEGFADRPRAVTLGADRGYDAADFVEELRTINCVRMSPAISAVAARRSIGVPRAILVMPRANTSASGSRKPSAGSRRSRACARPNCAAAQGRLEFHLRRGPLQSGAGAEADRGRCMSAAADCGLISRWRIGEADLWARDHLDLVEQLDRFRRRRRDLWLGLRRT
jgi:hypothetical protein